MEILDYLSYNENSKNAKWAQKHYNDAEFYNLSVKRESYGYVIEADIKCSGYRNDVKITIFNDGEVIKNCNCYFFDVNDPCGHYILTCMKLKEEAPFKIPFKFKNRKYAFDDDEEDILTILKRRKEEIRLRLEKEEKFAKRINSHNYINHAKEDLLSGVLVKVDNSTSYPKASIHLSIEAYEDNTYYSRYYYNNDLYIRFKIASNISRSYYIKDIAQFIDFINEEKNHAYGKELIFKHSIDVFDDYSKDIINYIRGYIKMNPGLYGAKYLKVDDYNGFFETFKDLPKKYHPDFEIKESDFRFTININRVDDHFELDLLDDLDNSFYSKKDQYYYSHDSQRIIRFPLSIKANNLINEIYRLGGLDIYDEDWNDFYRYIYLPIKDQIIFNGEFNIPESNLEKIEIYADVDEYENMTIVINHYFDHNKHYGFIAEEKPFECTLVEECINKYSAVIDQETHIATIMGDEKINAFIETAIPFLMGYAQVYVSEILKKYKEPKRLGINVGVKVENNLLNLDIEALNIKQEEIADILAAYHKKKRFHRLKNGDLIAINNDEFSELDYTLNELGISNKQLKKDINLPLYKGMMLESLGNEAGYNFEANEAYLKMIKDLKTQDILNFKVPDNYQGILKEYQIFGYRWLRMLNSYGFGGILADDMGLGKTIQFLSFLESIKSKDGYSLVICPASLIYNWRDEAHKFSKNLKVLCISGNQNYREEKIKQIKDYDLIVTSYDYIRRDLELYEDYTFDTVVLDEAQYIKNHSTKSAKSVKGLKAKYRLALSGTPIENTLAELWSIFDFLMPGYLNTYTHFKSTYELPIVKENNKEVVAKLKSYVEPFILRRKKKDVLKELPERIDKKLYFEFSKEEEKLYQANAILANKQLQEILNIDKKNVNKVQILAMLNKLRQLCIEPRLQYEDINDISSKMKGCIDLVKQLKENGEKTLIFSSYTSLFSFLELELAKEKISYYKLTGQTSKEERRELVDKFQKDKTNVFLISLKAGGTGLNLTSATAVIHFDPWWNISAQNQASDRAHRIGQKHTVQVFSLIMKNSIEEKIEQLQAQKKELADLFTEGNEGGIASMSKEDIMYLFKRDD